MFLQRRQPLGERESRVPGLERMVGIGVDDVPEAARQRVRGLLVDRAGAHILREQ
jgi:hypothetical protein